MPSTSGPWTLTREQWDSWGDAPRLVVRGALRGTVRKLVTNFDERDEKDARLVAAAPELLAACRAALEALEAPRRGRNEAMQMLLSAILKAEAGKVEEPAWGRK